MTRARTVRVLIVLAIVVVGYHWIGVASLGVGLVAFMLYELLTPPPRYRRSSLGQIEQATDNGVGLFGRSYPDDAPGSAPSRKVARNDSCPCGGGIKFKKCCGRVPA
jgi:hypothetical protein